MWVSCITMHNYFLGFFGKVCNRQGLTLAIQNDLLEKPMKCMLELLRHCPLQLDTFFFLKCIVNWEGSPWFYVQTICFGWLQCFAWRRLSTMLGTECRQGILISQPIQQTCKLSPLVHGFRWLCLVAFCSDMKCFGKLQVRMTAVLEKLHVTALAAITATKNGRRSWSANKLYAMHVSYKYMPNMKL